MSGDCSVVDQQTGGCTSSTGSVNGGGVDIGASQDVGGSTGSSGADDGGINVDDPSGEALDMDGFSDLRLIPDCTDPATCGAPAVHLSDLISFHPPAPTTSMEPNGWAVVNLDANFVASARTDVQSGSLLGAPAHVRFTPHGFSWDYGDGASKPSASGGSTWEQLRIPEFSPTATSHVYRRVGTYTVHVSLAYTAEYRFASQNWQHIAGNIDVPASDFTVIVGEAKTVLVGQDCAANPLGPGC